MTSRTRRPASIALGLVLPIIVGGCDRASEGKAGPATPAVTRVEVVHPERRTVRKTVSEPAQLQGFETTELHAKLSGYVKRWTHNIGDRVKAGEVLAELSEPELEAEAAQKQAAVEQAAAKRQLADAAAEVAAANVSGAEAKLTEARAGVKRVDAELARWRSEYQRVEGLFQARAQTGSLLDETRSKVESAQAAADETKAQVKTAEVGLTQAKAALDQARAEVASAESAVRVARADARRIEALLSYAKIQAPFDGVVIRRQVDTGQLTKPGADSDPLFVLVRTDILTVTTDVPELYAPDVGPGDRVSVTFQALQGHAVEGRVTRTAWALDPKTRTLRIEVDLPNPDGKLRPGVYAHATVIAEEHADVVTVPATAPVREGDRAFCTVVVGGKAVKRPVRLGLSDGTWTEIASGLEPRDVVVKANAASITEGQPLEAIEPAKP